MRITLEVESLFYLELRGCFLNGNDADTYYNLVGGKVVVKEKSNIILYLCRLPTSLV